MSTDHPDPGSTPVSQAEARPADRVIQLTLDGRVLTARTGDSVAAALIDAGIVSWRRTRKDALPRGLFCGIGICYDCLITIDGHPDQRACMAPVSVGMQLSTERRDATEGR
jgi:predicted molibdopterin-dependent oxidoreductase YjgC